jgi:hypothetical protein
MGMQDIKTDTKFACTFAVPFEELKYSKDNIIDWNKNHAALDLGRKISEVKDCWRFRNDFMPDMLVGEMRINVFTDNELSDFVEAKFKARLRKMSTDNHWTPEQREALLIASERF